MQLGFTDSFGGFGKKFSCQVVFSWTGPECPEGQVPEDCEAGWRFFLVFLGSRRLVYYYDLI